MKRFFQIMLCVLSVFLIIVAESSELKADLTEERNANFYSFIVLALLAIWFLQDQLYRYLVPNNIRRKRLDAGIVYYSKSFFRGTIGLGYLLAIMHLFGLSQTAELSGGYLYAGTVLIFCGTLSKVKGIISSELDNERTEASSAEYKC